jgi:hypothetical protein
LALSFAVFPHASRLSRMLRGCFRLKPRLDPLFPPKKGAASPSMGRLALGVLPSDTFFGGKRGSSHVFRLVLRLRLRLRLRLPAIFFLSIWGALLY